MKKIISILLIFFLSSCSSFTRFGAGVDITFDPRTIGMQIDDSIMQKNLSARLALMDKKYFFSSIVSLAIRFFSIIESSICVPRDLGSIATETPVPNNPLELVPEQLFKKTSNIKRK